MARTERVTFYMSESERADIEDAALEDGRSVSTWVLRACMEAVRTHKTKLTMQQWRKKGTGPRVVK